MTWGTLWWWLQRPRLGTKYDPFFTPHVSAMKLTRWKLLLSSPRNSVEGHVSLTKQSGCEFWFTSSGVDNVGFIQQLQIPCAEVPELPYLLDPTAVASYVYEKQFHEGRWDILAYLHTSGSTGLPKLVPMYLGTVATVDAFHLMEPIDGKMPNPVEWYVYYVITLHIASKCHYLR